MQRPVFWLVVGGNPLTTLLKVVFELIHFRLHVGRLAIVDVCGLELCKELVHQRPFGDWLVARSYASAPSPVVVAAHDPLDQALHGGVAAVGSAIGVPRNRAFAVLWRRAGWNDDGGAIYAGNLMTSD